MKIVILGGSGYLATCLCYYLKNDNKVTLVSRSNKKINFNYKNVEVKKVNYFSPKSLIKVFKSKDYIFHLVGANSFSSNKNKKKSFNLKKKSTQSIIEAANKTNTKIIYFSTSQVYKKINKIDVNEDSKTEKTNTYVSNHILAENLILEDVKKNNTRHKIIRISSVFGLPFWNKTNETFNLIINSLCLQAIKEKKIVILNPSTLRNFFPVSMLNKNKKYLFSGLKNKIINFGYQTFFLIDIAKMIQKICLKNFKYSPKIITQHKHKKKLIPNYYSKFFEVKKRNIFVEKEISKLLKLIYKNA